MTAPARRMLVRICEGCKRGLGTTPIYQHGYWHPRCWRKATEAQRAAAREAERNARSGGPRS